MPPTRPIHLAVTIALCLAALGGCTLRQHFAGDKPELPFSKGVLVGDTLYVAGHLGTDPNTGQAPADPSAEVALLLDGFAQTLQRAGMKFSDLVMVQVYCSDVGLYATFNEAYAARFRGAFPARAFIGSGKLLRGCRFEMLGTAVRR